MAERDSFYDCIRALAVTLVLFTHYRGWMPGGSIGVSVFFCLSGFLVCRILIGLQNASAVNVGKFIFRRFMRVWPMLAFQVFVVLGLILLLHPQDGPKYIPSVLGLLTFTSGYGEWVGFSPAILWTLRAEFWFYVLFAIAFFIVSRKHLPGLIAMAVVASWVAKFVYGHTGSAMFTLIYLDQLMFGVFCALVIDAQPNWLRYFADRVFLWFSLFAICLLGTIPFKQYDWIWYVQTSGAALWTAVLLLHHAANPVRGSFEPLASIGRISFSIYLIHAVVFDFTSRHIVNEPFDAIIIFSGIIGISLMTHRWIELPFIRMSKRLAPFLPVRSIEAVSAVPAPAE